MTKTALQELAAFGVRVKLATIERELRELHREFPGEFASATPPVILKPEAKAGGNNWPAFKAHSNGHSNGDSKPSAASAAWTPERRAKASRDMKRRLRQRAKGKSSNGKKSAAATAKPTAKKTWGSSVWHRAHDYLAGQPERQAALQDIMKASGAKTSASFITAADSHKDVFKRVSQGVYALKKIVRGEELPAD